MRYEQSNKSYNRRSANRSYQKDRHQNHYRYRSRSREQRYLKHTTQKYSKSGKEYTKYQRKCQSSSSRSDSSSYSSSRNSKSSKINRSGSTEKRRNAAHYHYQRGEKIGYKYRITEVLGDGTFGRVLKGEYEGKYFAIKVIKPVQKYIKSAKIERNIIKYINEKDFKDHYGIVKLYESFYHRNHFCIVFEQLGSSLYDLIKQNKYKGFSGNLVKKFFFQILRSLKFIHKTGYTHTDLKPQNILLQRDDFQKRQGYRGVQKYLYPIETKLRIIDFGSATKYNDRHSSIINTRQYRSPQVLLECCRWDQLSDVWSIGCIIVQLYTGNLLFDTHENHEHLAMIEKNSGKFPVWMIEKCKNQLKQMFGKNGKIKESRLQKYVGAGQNIIYMKTADQIFQNDPELRDLLRKCLQIDPNHRISCSEALKHRYFDDFSY